jgi:hypothetical protein
MGFYSDSLIFFSLATEELEYKEKDNLGDCLRAKIFGNDIKMIWKPIWKTSREDGDIFGEGGMYGAGESGKDYLVSLLSMGIISRPSHLQHTLFFFDKEFLGNVFDKAKIHDGQKKAMHPSDIFVVYLADEYNALQKPPKK